MGDTDRLSAPCNRTSETRIDRAAAPRTILGMTSKCDEMPMLKRKSAVGFTLVELMVTVSILVILLAVGAPQLTQFLEKQRVISDVERLSMAMRLARSEALKRSGRVSICPLPASGATACAATTQNWSHGWMVFIDARDEGGEPFDSGRDTPVSVESGTRTSAVAFNVNRRVLSFEANGLLNSAMGSFTIGTAGVTDGVMCKKLTMNNQGRLSSDKCAAPKSADDKKD